jgi:hypothetical protein
MEDHHGCASNAACRSFVLLSSVIRRSDVSQTELRLRRGSECFGVATNAVFPGGDYEGLKNKFAGFSEQTWPLN